LKKKGVGKYLHYLKFFKALMSGMVPSNELWSSHLLHNIHNVGPVCKWKLIKFGRMKQFSFLFWYFIRKFFLELLYPNTTPTSTTVKCYKIMKFSNKCLRHVPTQKIKIKWNFWSNTRQWASQARFSIYWQELLIERPHFSPTNKKVPIDFWRA